MIKKKAKSRAEERISKRAPGKKSGGKKSQKELNPGEVRKDISRMVESEAATMVQAAIDEGNKGQLAPMKYLFEVANIFPAATDGSEASTEEDSLARTLLRRMDIPEEPVVRQDEDGVRAAGPAVDAGKQAEEATVESEEANGA